MTQNKEAENLCPTCGEPYVKLDREGDAQYCKCWSTKLHEALEEAGELPSKQSVDFLLAPKLRDLETGKRLKGAAAEEASEALFSSKASAFRTWDAQGRSKAEKQELQWKQSKQINVMFKEQPDQPESATLKQATPTAKLEEKLLNAGLTSDEVELALWRYWDKATLEAIKEKFGFSSEGTTDRRCKSVLRKIRKSGVLSREDEV